MNASVHFVISQTDFSRPNGVENLKHLSYLTMILVAMKNWSQL